MAVANGYFRTPPVVKNLLLINVIIFIAQELLPVGPVMQYYGSLHFSAEGGLPFFLVHSYQLVTYMFLHADFGHLFSNMFTLWMFGRILEYDLGGRRFLIFYMLCGIGAGFIQLGVNWIEFLTGIGPAVAMTLGASGAVFGLLLAFAMFRPNSVIMLLFPPIPLKAKWFVIIYGALELWAGVRGTGGNVAHFAHLGGMLIAFLLLKYWKKKGVIYY